MSSDKKRRKTGKRGERRDLGTSFNLDDILHKYIWFLVPILVMIYYWYSTGSTGFYQDDEIGHYRNIRQFWGDPFSIMGNQPKPGWKILMVVPGLFGFHGVLIAHCLISALVVLATYYYARTINLKNASAGVLLLAFQPLYLQLAFRSYSEISAALFVVLMMLFHARKKYILAAICSSYIFSIRQEFAIVSIGLGVLLLYRRQWSAFLLLAWTPLALALIGWLSTGNISWILDDMQRIGLGVQVPHKPFWHYFETYIFIVGPVTLSLCLVGYWSFLSHRGKWKELLLRHGFLYFTFTSMFLWGVLSAWDALDFGANPGHWRYLLSISPLTAVFALLGLNIMAERSRRQYTYVVLLAFAFVSLLFLSYESNGLTLLTTREFLKAGIVFLLLVLAWLYASGRIMPLRLLLSTIVAIAIVHTVHSEEPRKLDSESATVKQAAEWYSAQEEYADRPLLANHVLLRYFADIDINDKKRDIPLQKQTLENAPPGSLCFWDSHYGYSQFGGDVEQDYFRENPSFRFITQFISPDQRFGILVFEKQ